MFQGDVDDQIYAFHPRSFKFRFKLALNFNNENFIKPTKLPSANRNVLATGR